MAQQNKGKTEPPALNITVHGSSGAPLVFLHGLGGTSRYWTCKLTGEPLNRPAVFVDLLGFGNSPQPWFRYTVERHLAALHAALKPFEPMTVVGHSLGAALALIYAARYPGKVKALVLVSLPYYSTQDRATAWLRRTPSGWLFTNMLVAGLTCIITRRVTGWLLPLILTNYPREVAEDLVKHNAMSSVTSLWNVLYRLNLKQEARKLPPDMPVLCLHSEDDDTAPIAEVRELARGFQNWHLDELTSVRHHPWLWATDTCREKIDTFIMHKVPG